MPEYLIQTRAFSTKNPAYAVVDDDKYPNQVVCYPKQDPGNKGHWKVIPEGADNNPLYYLQLADDTEQRQAIGDPFSVQPVVVGKPGVLWIISPPLSQGDANTPRTIATALNDRLHISEWTAHGEPDTGIPKSLVRIQIRTFNQQVNLGSLWHIIPVN